MSEDSDKKPEELEEDNAPQEEAPAPTEEQVTEEPEPEKKSGGFGWPHAFAIIGTLVLLIIAYLANALVSSGFLDDDAKKRAELNAKINTRFAEHISTLITAEPQMTVAKRDVKERFLRPDGSLYQNGWYHLDEDAIDIRLPVTYEYTIDMAEDWKLDLAGNVCAVYAPALNIVLPVYVETSKMETYSIASLEPKEQLLAIETDIAMLLEKRAKEQVDTIRVKAEDFVERFIHLWLINEGFLKEGDVTAVKVTFAQPKSEVIKKIVEPKAEEPAEEKKSSLPNGEPNAAVEIDEAEEGSMPPPIPLTDPEPVEEMEIPDAEPVPSDAEPASGTV